MTTAHVLMVIDRSGSMHDIVEDAQGGIRSFIEEQKNLTDENGEAVPVSVSLAQFDNEFEWVFRSRDIHAVPEYTLEPRAMTALLDAVGRALTEDLASGAATVADRKVAVIVTDGLENASKEWTQDAVKELIQTRKDEGWQVVFLATDITTINMGRHLGMQTTGYDRGSTQTLYSTAAASTAKFSAGRAQSVDMPDEVRDSK